MIEEVFDRNFMLAAIQEACKCKKGNDQFPIGAIIVRNGEIVSRGHSKDKHTNIPTDHAEIIAVNKACKTLGRLTLSDCTLFTTAEPCQMCLSVIFQARIQEIVFGAFRKDLPMRKKMITIDQLVKDAGYEVLITPGILQTKCLALFRKQKLLSKK